MDESIQMLLWDEIFPYKRPAREEFVAVNEGIIEKAKK